jgi:hypothetical protein
MGYLSYLHHEMEVSRGLIPGHYSVIKYGRNTVVDALEDIWDGGGLWAAPTTARKHAIVSTSANDDKDSTGVHKVRVYGLQDWDSIETSEEVTLEGQTPVNTLNSYVIIHRMHAVPSAGGKLVNVGTITATAATDGTVTAQINIGAGQTQMAIYGVPSTYDLFLNAYYVGMNKAGGASQFTDVSLLYNSGPDVELTGFLTKHTMGLLSTGTSHMYHPFEMHNRFRGPGILKVNALPSAAGQDISAGFEGMLEMKRD